MFIGSEMTKREGGGADPHVYVKVLTPLGIGLKNAMLYLYSGFDDRNRIKSKSYLPGQMMHFTEISKLSEAEGTCKKSAKDYLDKYPITFV